jgi:hypothetical protein
MTDVFSNLDVPMSSIPGNIDFVESEGTTTSALTHTTLEYRFPCDSDSDARFLRLKPVENVDAPQIARVFDNLRGLDADELTIQERYTIQDIRFEVKTNNPVDGEEHQVKIQVPVQATPFLNKLLTHNPEEAEATAEICSHQDVDAVVTPFAAHANTLREKIEQSGSDTPVYRPSELAGQQLASVVVSFGISDDRRMVVPPINEIETLYTVLNSGKDLTIVGDKQTLERNSIIASLL